MRQEKVDKFREILSSDLIKEKAKKHGADDQRERKLTLIPFFWLTIFSHFQKTTNGFLNILVSKFVGSNLAKAKEDSRGDSETISRMAISKQFQRRTWKFFRDIFNHLLQIYMQKLPSKIGKVFRRFSDVVAVDGSVIRLCKLLRKKFKSTKKNRAACKIHVKFSVKNLVPKDAKITAETVNERKYNFIEKTRNFLYLFDLGYYGIALFNRIIDAYSFFVSRLKSNINPLIVSGQYKGKNLFEVIKNIKRETIDFMVTLKTKGAEIKKNLRLIGILYEGEWYFYLTNILDKKFKPIDIYTLYTYRWTIEIFFNELKHVLRLENICCRNENGIKIEIYAAFILYILTRIIINEASIRSDIPVRLFSFKRCFEILTQIIDSMYMKIVFEKYDILLLIDYIIAFFILMGMKDSYYINNNYKA